MLGEGRAVTLPRCSSTTTGHFLARQQESETVVHGARLLALACSYLSLLAASDIYKRNAEYDQLNCCRCLRPCAHPPTRDRLGRQITHLPTGL